jgi:hypothetical protein
VSDALTAWFVLRKGLLTLSSYLLGFLLDTSSLTYPSYRLYTISGRKDAERVLMLFRPKSGCGGFFSVSIA